MSGAPSDGMTRRIVRGVATAIAVLAGAWLVALLFTGEPYYLGVFLVGAYQEILGDLHNLFGDTHAVHVSLDPSGNVNSFCIRWWVRSDMHRRSSANIGVVSIPG